MHVAAYLPFMHNELLYLDFDGVLHPSDVLRHRETRELYLPPELVAQGHRLFEHAELLTTLLEPYADVRIVLSTSWAYALGFDTALSYLPTPLAGRVIGTTWETPMTPHQLVVRGRQVLADVERRSPTAWLAIDDNAENWPGAHLSSLIRTHTKLGISEPAVLTALTSALARTFTSKQNAH